MSFSKSLQIMYIVYFFEFFIRKDSSPFLLHTWLLQNSYFYIISYIIINKLTTFRYPSIPSGGEFPYNRTTRPYTTFELDQIRNHAKGFIVIHTIVFLIKLAKKVWKFINLL